jgi:hypothetical protein
MDVPAGPMSFDSLMGYFSSVPGRQGCQKSKHSKLPSQAGECLGYALT